MLCVLVSWNLPMWPPCSYMTSQPNPCCQMIITWKWPPSAMGYSAPGSHSPAFHSRCLYWLDYHNQMCRSTRHSPLRAFSFFRFFCSIFFILFSFMLPSRAIRVSVFLSSLSFPLFFFQCRFFLLLLVADTDTLSLN